MTAAKKAKGRAAPPTGYVHGILTRRGGATALRYTEWLRVWCHPFWDYRLNVDTHTSSRIWFRVLPGGVVSDDEDLRCRTHRVRVVPPTTARRVRSILAKLGKLEAQERTPSVEGQIEELKAEEQRLLTDALLRKGMVAVVPPADVAAAIIAAVERFGLDKVATPKLREFVAHADNAEVLVAVREQVGWPR